MTQRKENELFEDYQQRRREENKQIKEKLKGTLIWNSLREVKGKIVGNTFVKPKE